MNFFYDSLFQQHLAALTPQERSDRERELGNQYFRSGKNYPALAHYNKAITYGHKDKERVALCYANRSAVYLEMKHFKHCLQNIDLAEPHYPKDKIQKLHDRRQKCLKMMADCADKMLEPFDHSFKLSYEPNPKLPFLIDAIELKRNAKFGRHLITSIDLKAGDVIAVIGNPLKESNANIIEKDQIAVGCYNCMKFNNFNLIAGNCQALFCSLECKKQHELKDPDHESFHEMESAGRPRRFILTAKLFLKFYDAFGSFENLMDFVNAHSGQKFTAFDFDWNLPDDDPAYIKNLLLMVKSVNVENVEDVQKIMKRNIWDQQFIMGFMIRLKPENRFKKIFEATKTHMKFWKKIMWHIWDYYDTCIELKFELKPQNAIGTFFHPALTLLNHSCDPNIFVKINRNNEIVWIANQPITAGSQLFYAYAEKLFFFAQTCQTDPCPLTFSCKPCREVWQAKIDEQKIMSERECNAYHFFKNRADVENKGIMLKYLDSCCDYINKNYKTSYYKNAELIQEISTKKSEMLKILDNLCNPFPPKNVFYLDVASSMKESNRFFNDTFGIHNGVEMLKGVDTSSVKY